MALTFHTEFSDEYGQQYDRLSDNHILRHEREMENTEQVVYARALFTGSPLLVHYAESPT